MSHLTQMLGLTVQNFVSAAVGMAVMAALIRGLARAGGRTIGNFWVDLVRTTFRILLPIAFVVRGRPRRLRRDPEHARIHTTVHTVAGATQQIPGGPVAEPGGDQAARHERRRLLQHELRPPVREPDRVQRLRRALRDLDHPVRARVHLRSDGQGQAPGLRGVRGHGRALAGVGGGAASRRGRRQPRARRARRDAGGHRRRRRAATSKARRPASARRRRRSAARRRRARPTARSTRCTTATRRSAARSRWRT